MKLYRRMVALVAALMMTIVATPASAATPDVPVVDVKVMSQNLYIGADLGRILQGESPAAVFQTAVSSNIGERLATFSAQVAAQQPDLIGLQEVTNIVVFTADGTVVQNIDYLDIVTGTLAAQGRNYAVSSVVVNADVTLPIDLAAGIFARVIDRDVIVHNTATTTVSNPESANFAVNFAVPLGGVPVEFTRGYTAVDAVVGGNDFRFVNTHLEVQNAPCLTPEGLVICQEVQAAELVEALADETAPVILLGDFNSEPGEPTYQTIVDGGYADTWNAPDGDTCCETELLDEPTSNLTQRIDHIFHGTATSSLVSATTETITAKTPSGLWYSDHAGVVADLRLLDARFCDGLTPTIEGTEGSDVIIGTAGDDIIFSYGGNDVIQSFGGDDIICDSGGNDTIDAGDNDDAVVAVGGNNVIETGQGDDVVITGQGNDVVSAGAGDDRVDVGDGSNVVDAGSGDNIVLGAGN